MAAAPPSVLARRPLAVAAGALVLVGLAVSTAGRGPAADLTGDALYAALVWVVLALLAPGRSLRALTSAAVGICTVVELAQLTGVPAAATSAWWPARFVLGTTFAWPDLAAYAVGAVAAGCAARGVRRGTAVRNHVR